ncbi:hypothetical protein PInf_026347 [Phytophthora infestans]|nr:hypothetical protein PInf_026313 [Phytophthora infestans]KAI9980487.1 hypothetical protein PInf_026347 [Phytophthora infestans]
MVDRVWMYKPPRDPKATKFVHQWVGLLKIVESAGFENYLLEREDQEGVTERFIAHVSFLVTYHYPTDLLKTAAVDIDSSSSTNMKSRSKAMARREERLLEQRRTAGPDDDDGARQKWHVVCQKNAVYGDVGLCDSQFVILLFGRLERSRQRMALEDVRMKTVVLKCACLRITGNPVRQVLRGGLGRSQTNLRRGEQVALLSE